MAAVIPVLNPALQVVNSGGGLIYGQIPLAFPAMSVPAQGFVVESVDVQYPAEMLGPWLSATYEQRWKLLGIRPAISISFSLILADDNPILSSYGLRALETLWHFGIEEPGGNRLQFTLFNNWGISSQYWRDVFFTAPWEPKKIAGKQVAYTGEMKLSTRNLVPPSYIGSWADKQW